MYLNQIGEKGEPAVLPQDFFKYEVSGIAGKQGPQGKTHKTYHVN